MVFMGMVFSKFILFGSAELLESRNIISFAKFGKFGEIISSNILSVPISLLSFGTPVTCMLGLFVWFHEFLGLCPFFSCYFFPSFR